VLANSASAEIRDCHFEGHLTPDTFNYAIDALNFSDIKVYNCDFKNINDGINVRFGSIAEIEIARLENCYYDGVYTRDGSSVIIEDYKFLGTGWGMASYQANINARKCNIENAVRGASASYNSSLVIKDSVVKNCSSDGIYYEYQFCTGTAGNVIVSDCENAGISVLAGPSVQIENALVYNSYYGLAIFAGSADVINSTFTKNGYGIWAWTLPWYAPVGLSVKNSIVARNGRGIDCESRTVPSITYCDVWWNVKYNYNNCSPGTGCISSDPEFIDPDANDFHLQETSSCIDTGDAVGAPNVDAEGTYRPQGAEIDIGAYEYCSPFFALIYPPKSAEISDPTPTFKWECPPEDSDKTLHYKLEVAKYGTPGINEVEVESKKDAVP